MFVCKGIFAASYKNGKVRLFVTGRMQSYTAL